LPGQEQAVRANLREATLKLVDAATTDADQLPADFKLLPLEANLRLEKLTQRVLRDYPGVEGGFYIGGEHDEFAGYAFPTEPARGPRGPARREPPPREEQYIRIQARQSASQDSTDVLIESRDVGPSRV